MSFLKESMNIFSLHIFTSFILKSSLESKTNLNILDLEMTELYHHSKIKSALNDIFHWYSHLVMTLRSSLIRAVLEPLFWVFENNDVSSTNILQVEVISFHKLFAYSKRKILRYSRYTRYTRYSAKMFGHSKLLFVNDSSSNFLINSGRCIPQHCSLKIKL